MERAAAKQGDRVVATDMHLIQPPGPSSPVLVPHQFDAPLQSGLIANVQIGGMPAATVGSIAVMAPMHVPMGGTFVRPPTGQGRIIVGSTTVRIGGQAAARDGDTALTCNDPTDLPVGRVVATGTVRIGG